MLLFLAPAILHAAKSKVASVTMLSDIHFDPFHDPAKFNSLRTSGVRSWPEILGESDSVTQEQDYEALQNTCGAKGSDTPITLLKSSLQAARLQNRKPLFITVSGDLIAHNFECRFKTLAPTASNAEYSDFAAKTVAFVAYELWIDFPATPVYLSLGNNDSGCGDYQEDTASKFLRAAGITVASNAKEPSTRYAIMSQFFRYGAYNVKLPGPMGHTRLIVLQDLFESKKYKSCAADSALGNMSPSEIQITWLRKQLAAARKAHNTVWIMTHIPPGVDAYNTVAKQRDVCGGDQPESFLSSDALLNTITDYGDIVRLAVFGHTHMDELRVFKATGLATDKPGPQIDGIYVPGKLVPSISPIDGNNPTFLVAQVDPRTATVQDYTAYSAAYKPGSAIAFHKEYTFSTAYQLPDLSGTALHRLSETMLDDKAGTAPTSLRYQQFFYSGGAGMASTALQAVWPVFSCTIAESSGQGFHDCVCPVTPVASAGTPAQR